MFGSFTPCRAALLGLVLAISTGCYHRGASEYIGSVRADDSPADAAEGSRVVRGIDLPMAGSPGAMVVEGSTAATASRIEDLFVGRFPGLDVQRLGDGGLVMRLRGREPLVVIDGMEADASALVGLQPREVVRIEVLRNVSETALYGSRGNDGVVRITTRR